MCMKGGYDEFAVGRPSSERGVLPPGEAETDRRALDLGLRGTAGSG